MSIFDAMHHNMDSACLGSGGAKAILRKYPIIIYQKQMSNAQHQR
jgi:hypothetical protein